MRCGAWRCNAGRRPWRSGPCRLAGVCCGVDAGRAGVPASHPPSPPPTPLGRAHTGAAGRRHDAHAQGARNRQGHLQARSQPRCEPGRGRGHGCRHPGRTHGHGNATPHIPHLSHGSTHGCGVCVGGRISSLTQPPCLRPLVARPWQGGVLRGDVKDILLLDVTPLSLGGWARQATAPLAPPLMARARGALCTCTRDRACVGGDESAAAPGPPRTGCATNQRTRPRSLASSPTSKLPVRLQALRPWAASSRA